MRYYCLLACLLLVTASSAEGLRDSENTELKQRLTEVVTRLARVGEKSRKGLKFGLVQGDVVNAFVPDKNPDLIVVFEGAVSSLPEAQLYFLVGHEYVHANRKHRAKQGGQDAWVSLGRLGLAILTRNSTEEQKKSIEGLGDDLEALAHNQYSQAQEQEADRESVRMLAKLGYDPVNALLYFQTQSPANEKKDVMGTHPTFAARFEDIARFLPTVEFEPPEISNSKSLIVLDAVHLRENTFQGGQFNSALSNALYAYLNGAGSGLILDQNATLVLQGQVQQRLEDAVTPQYLLKVKRFQAKSSTTALETDLLSDMIATLKVDSRYRAFSVACATDSYGNHQVALLLLR